MGRDAFGVSDSKVMAADYRLNIDEEEINVDTAFARDDDIKFHELIANAEGIDDFFTILHSESMAGNAKRVKTIVSAYADKNILVKVDSNKETALHIAADCGHTEVVEVLLDAARQLSSSSANDDPLHQVTTFENFIRQPNDSMNTALHLAVSNGHMAIAKLLVKADPSDRHIQNSMSETPIYLAAKLGYEEIVQMICETCTAPALDGPNGTTALHAAITMLTKGKNDGLAVVKALTAAAKSSASSANGSYSSVRSFLRKSNEKNKDTALHLAVRRNHLDVAKHILDVDLSLLTKNKRSDFKSTIYKAAELGYTDMVTLLCKRYDDQNKHVHKDLIGLCAAIVGRNAASAIDILKKANHLATYDDHKGWTPLHYAAYYEFDFIVDTIIEAQASIKWEVVYKKKVPTPLCVAAKEGHTSTVIRLMQLLPDSCIIVNYEGQNVLHLAAVQNNRKMVHGILKHCAEEYAETILYGKDVNGNTPLHLLISQGCFIPELILGLASESTDNLKWPVDMMIMNNKGWTPADMLYFQDEIIGDQFWRINKRGTSVPLESMGRSSTQDSLVPLSMRSRKDAEINKVIKRMMDEEGIRVREIGNSQMVITALITTITFTVGFTMPGGLHQSGESDQGLAVLSQKRAFKVFMVADALAFLLSSTSLFLYFKMAIGEQEAKPETTIAMLNMFSILAMVITFISGTYVVLSHTPALANTVATMCSLYFTLIYLWGIKTVSQRKMMKERRIMKKEQS